MGVGVGRRCVRGVGRSCVCTGGGQGGREDREGKGKGKGGGERFVKKGKRGLRMSEGKRRGEEIGEVNRVCVCCGREARSVERCTNREVVGISS